MIISSYCGLYYCSIGKYKTVGSSYIEAINRAVTIYQIMK